VIPDRFGSSPVLSLGVEEELMILDADTLEPADGVAAVVEGVRGLDLPGVVKTEMHASVVELNTGVCASGDEAVAALAELRAGAAEAARAHGLVLAAAGAHPTARLESLPVVQEERYLAMIGRIGRAARRQGVSGLHVHVSVESGEHCHERLEAVLPWLPVLLALSANSPFADGADTGMLSARAAILAELPRAGAPPVFGSYAGWTAWVERLAAAGVLEDETRLWWDVRPNPRLGTLELRIADQPTALERTALLVRAMHDLVARVPSRIPDPVARGDYAQNRWAAARHGLDAVLLHPDGGGAVVARELAAELLRAAPPEPEALRQREVAARAGQQLVAADLVARTVA